MSNKIKLSIYIDPADETQRELVSVFMEQIAGLQSTEEVEEAAKPAKTPAAKPASKPAAKPKAAEVTIEELRTMVKARPSSKAEIVEWLGDMDAANITELNTAHYKVFKKFLETIDEG